MAAPLPEETKLQRFLQWLQANGADLRDCTIKHRGPDGGFGVFSTADAKSKSVRRSSDDIVMVVPLDLAITPMRVLQDPLLGPRCRAMFEEGAVDDRFLLMLYLTVERLRSDSRWKPYLDMLPSTFGNPLWFTEDELAELKGTSLYRASMLQRKELQILYDGKVKDLVQEVLCQVGKTESVREVQFEDFLWANSTFWARGLNIQLPHSFVFPVAQVVQDNTYLCHAPKAAATWEVDQSGSVTGVPNSMYLMLADESVAGTEKEIYISYGNKGNEELLYGYGFVVDNNPDDYLMVHYPMVSLQNVPFSDTKAKLLEMQKAELRCLLPRKLLDLGFFGKHTIRVEENPKGPVSRLCNYSWSGQRQVPSYLSQLIFPQDFITALRTIAMQEYEIEKVSSLLEEVDGSKEDRQLSDKEVLAAVWEVCGDYGAFELLVDLLRVKLMELEEGSGTEASDAELLGDFNGYELEDHARLGHISILISKHSSVKKVVGDLLCIGTEIGCICANHWFRDVMKHSHKKLDPMHLEISNVKCLWGKKVFFRHDSLNDEPTNVYHEYIFSTLIFHDLSIHNNVSYLVTTI